MPKDVIASVASNDSSITKVDLSANATFQMKPVEYCESLAEALANNKFVTEVALDRCNIPDPGVQALSNMLTTNQTIVSLSLDGNKIGSDGAVSLANALVKNETLTDLILTGQDKQAFGETCLEAWLECLQDNITMQNIKWRLNSRKATALNTYLTRNKEIVRRKKDGKEFETLLPTSRRSSVGNATESPVAAEAPAAAESPSGEAPTTEAPPAAEEPAGDEAAPAES
eukprot:TRINITY_DN1776_c0_g1_i1.p1 TRINITY_DN1776_c0_g1~~TRINITY_DN1776_c0_g1_i1.p1  ORF type:complete len:255 (+),score=63.43 TRINITY_DN1776_c0_g1_i1:82-765(+)